MSKILVKSFHSSWLLAIASLGLVVGTVTAKYIHTMFFLSYVWIFVSVLLVAICLYRQQIWCVVLAVVAGLILGYGRGVNEYYAQQQIANFYNQTVVLRGRVSEDVTRKSNSSSVKLDKLSINGKKLDGVVWASLAGDSSGIKRSDYVTAKGLLDDGFATFNGSMYRAKIIHVDRYSHTDIAREVRDWFSGGIKKIIKSPEVDLGLGYLLGEKSSLPDALGEALKIAGLTHVVVASGYNLTILVRLSRRFFMRISRYSALLGSIALVACFVLVTGVGPSMSRAAVVTALSLLAWFYGRNVHPIVLLMFSAGVTVYIRPSYAWGDIGWLLSFTAFFGVLILAPLLQRYFFGDKKPGTIRQILGETFCAQLLTMPIIMYTFGTVSYVALVANLLVLPLVPLAMLLVFISGVLALVYIPFALIVGKVTYFLLHYMVWVTEKLAGFDWSSGKAGVSMSIVIAIYVAIILCALYLRRATKDDLSDYSVIE